MGRKIRGVKYPRNLTIETSSLCNLKCVMCPQSIGAVKRPIKMPEETLDKIIPYIKQSKTVSLHGIGEPFLSESFWKLLENIPEKCISTVNTNLTILTDEMIHRLFKSRLDSISVSVDSPYKEDYFKIRGFDLSVVLSNIKRLTGQNIKIYANMTLMVCTIDSIIHFLDLMIGEIGCDRVYVWPLNKWDKSDTKSYNREIRGMNFNYEEQGLWNCDYLPKIQQARKYAKEKGWKFYCLKEE